jgi:hypothetical protein
VPSIKFGVEIFDRVAWAFGPCIATCPYLRPILTIDAEFLSGRYAGKLFMACGYDAEQQLLPLTFAGWEARGLVFSQKVTEMIKHRGDKRETYDVIPLDWDINNYDVYNINGLIETVIFYAYIIFYLILKFKQ